MSIDRRTDGPTLLRAEIVSARRLWGRRPAVVRVTSRSLCWGPTGHEHSVVWTDVTSVREGHGVLAVAYVDEDGTPQDLRVTLEGPVGYLVAEECQRRTEGAHRNSVAFAGAVAC